MYKRIRKNRSTYWRPPDEDICSSPEADLEPTDLGEVISEERDRFRSLEAEHYISDLRKGILL